MVAGLRPAELPGWPRGLREPLAAAYLGISETMLRAEVTAGRLKATPVSAGRIVYLRERLDAWLDAKDGKTPIETGMTEAEIRAKEAADWMNS